MPKQRVEGDGVAGERCVARAEGGKEGGEGGAEPRAVARTDSPDNDSAFSDTVSPFLYHFQRRFLKLPFMSPTIYKSMSMFTTGK